MHGKLPFIPIKSLGGNAWWVVVVFKSILVVSFGPKLESSIILGVSPNCGTFHGLQKYFTIHFGRMKGPCIISRAS